MSAERTARGDREDGAAGGAAGGGRVAVKICGLWREADIFMVNRLSPDYVGFVFARSKRRTTLIDAHIIKSWLRPHIKTVGVFVNAKLDTVDIIARTLKLDFIQLHGSEDAEYIRAVKELTKKPVIRAIKLKRTGGEPGAGAGANVGAGADAGSAASAAPAQFSVSPLICEGAREADYLLFDGPVPGTGAAFDWGLLSAFEGKPFFLAGGLTPKNVRKAIDTVKPFAVDVSSGVETDGVKDAAKIEEFIRRVRNG